jgi:hypothetical protein
MATPMIQLQGQIQAPKGFSYDLNSKPSAAPAPSNVPANVDPDVVRLQKAIKQHESGGKTTALGASGEGGGYQFMPGTWKSWAGQYLGDENAPVTNANQNQVAYSKIKEWKDQGKTPAQIASLWNSGSDQWEGKVGVNSQGVKYDVPSYVNNVGRIYQQLKTQEPIGQQQPTPQGTEMGAEEPKKEGLLASMGKGLVSSLVKPFTTPFAGLAQGLTGKDVNLPWWAGDVNLSNDLEQNARETGSAALNTAALLPIGSALKGIPALASGGAKAVGREALAGGLRGTAYGASGAL